MTYCSKANTNSSLRVKIGAAILNTFEDFRKYSLPSKTYVNKKMKRISNINTIIRENTNCLENQDFKQNKICYDPNIKKITKTDEKSPTYFPVTNLDII